MERGRGADTESNGRRSRNGVLWLWLYGSGSVKRSRCSRPLVISMTPRARAEGFMFAATQSRGLDNLRSARHPGTQNKHSALKQRCTSPERETSHLRYQTPLRPIATNVRNDEASHSPNVRITLL